MRNVTRLVCATCRKNVWIRRFSSSIWGTSSHSPASTVLSISRSSSSSAAEGTGSCGIVAVGLLGWRVPLGILLFLLPYIPPRHLPTGDDSFQKQFFSCFHYWHYIRIATDDNDVKLLIGIALWVMMRQ